MTKFYVDTQGNYLGGFDGAEPPQGSIEVPDAPNHGLDKYKGGVWVIPQLTTLEIRAQLQPLSAWQVRKVLTQFNLRTQVETAISNADQNTKDAWEYAGEFRRDDAMLNALGASLLLTDEQVDELFTVGITL